MSDVGLGETILIQHAEASGLFEVQWREGTTPGKLRVGSVTRCTDGAALATEVPQTLAAVTQRSSVARARLAVDLLYEVGRFVEGEIIAPPIVYGLTSYVLHGIDAAVYEHDRRWLLSEVGKLLPDACGDRDSPAHQYVKTVLGPKPRSAHPSDSTEAPPAEPAAVRERARSLDVGSDTAPDGRGRLVIGSGPNERRLVLPTGAWAAAVAVLLSQAVDANGSADGDD